MATDTPKRIEAAQKKYDDLAEKSSRIAKDDKQFRVAAEAELKQKFKARFGDREKIMKDKSEAHRELVALKTQWESEVLAAVAKHAAKPDAAQKELMSLGHTANSADILIGRALGNPAGNMAPEPASSAPTAPLPSRDEPPESEQGLPIKVTDPISAKVPESQAVNYKDSGKDSGK